jgi:hypothetical protein
MKVNRTVLLGLLLMLAEVGRAATITVTSTNDSGPGSLRAALAAAANGDTIDATGVSSRILLSSGELLVNRSVAILGPGPARLAVDGNATSRVFHISNAVMVSISGLTVTHGMALGFGGGITTDGGMVLTISNCIVTGNGTGGYQGGYGGGIYFSGGTLMVTDSTLSRNSAGRGGGIFGGGPTTVANSTLSQNSATFLGGGIYTGSSLEITNSVLSGNYSAGSGTDLGGGGIFNYFGPVMTVVNSTFSFNSTAGSGGGIDNRGGTVTIENSTFSGNSARGWGGGIENDATGPGYSATLRVSNSTLSGNASGGGGAIANDPYGGTATVVIFNSTLSGNSGAGYGDSIHNLGTVEFGSTILNVGHSGTNLWGFGTVISDGYNLSSDRAGGGLTQPTDWINTDPMVGPLQNNGGPTFTHALLPGSPAIDKGKNFSGSVYDQRGSAFPRTYDNPGVANAPGGDGTDIGAFELTPPPCSTVVTSLADSGPGSLRAALACASDGDTIDVTGVSGTILLTSGELVVNKSVTIFGSGSGILAVDGHATNRVFHVTNAVNAVIVGLAITNGNYYRDFTGGGGILNDHSTLTVSNCAFNDNAAIFGGAVANYGSPGNATLTIANCTFANNSAGLGGAVDNNGRGGNATLTIIHCTLDSNSATEAGGILNDGEDSGYATLTIANSTISGNTGGGAYNIGYGTLTLIYSTVSSNSAYQAGGILNNSTAALINSTVSGNSADYSGGGIYNNSSSTLRLLNSTITGNSGGSFDSGIWNQGTVQIGSTILNGGSLAPTITPFISGAVVSLGFNLSSDDGAGYLTNRADQINTDPMLGPLQDNGGPTLTHALLCGSPAIDRGKNFSGSAIDQRGLPRTFDDPFIANAVDGDSTDIGAFEVQQVCDRPPVADARATPSLVISGNGSTAQITLDASRSFDPDGNPLQYSWYVDGSPAASASGGTATVVLSVGTHSVLLAVSDGTLTASDTITIQVITATQAIEQLIAEVDAAGERERPLDASLHAALDSVQRGKVRPAINQLQAFQNKVRAQVAPTEPALALQFIQNSQAIIDVLPRH